MSFESVLRSLETGDIVVFDIGYETTEMTVLNPSTTGFPDFEASGEYFSVDKPNTTPENVGEGMLELVVSEHEGEPPEKHYGWVEGLCVVGEAGMIEHRCGCGSSVFFPDRPPTIRTCVGCGTRWMRDSDGIGRAS